MSGSLKTHPLESILQGIPEAPDFPRSNDVQIDIDFPLQERLEISLQQIRSQMQKAGFVIKMESSPKGQLESLATLKQESLEMIVITVQRSENRKRITILFQGD